MSIIGPSFQNTFLESFPSATQLNRLPLRRPFGASMTPQVTIHPRQAYHYLICCLVLYTLDHRAKQDRRLVGCSHSARDGGEMAIATELCHMNVALAHRSQRSHHHKMTKIALSLHSPVIILKNSLVQRSPKGLNSAAQHQSSPSHYSPSHPTGPIMVPACWGLT